jgi:hypothetical protein
MFHADANNFHWCETSRPKWSLTRVEMAFSWVDRMGWVHEVVCEIIVTRPGSERHQAGYCIDLANTRAPLEWNYCKKALVNPQQYASMVDMNQGVHLVRSE